MKSLSSPYLPDSRTSGHWCKLKKDYIDGLADTFDVVPVGAWRGQGRKAEKGFWSPWLLAVRNKETGRYQTLCRVLSLTDEVRVGEVAKKAPSELPPPS